MTAVRIVWVVCDAPDDQVSSGCWEQTGDGSIMGGTRVTVTEAREDARDAGWHKRSGDRDICGSCWDEGVR